MKKAILSIFLLGLSFTLMANELDEKEEKLSDMAKKTTEEIGLGLVGVDPTVVSPAAISDNPSCDT